MSAKKIFVTERVVFINTQFILCVSIYLRGHKELDEHYPPPNHLIYRLTESKTQQQLYLLQLLNTPKILVAEWKLTAM